MRVQKRQRGPRSDVKLLCSQLRTLAFEKGPGAKMPTVLDLCLSFGTHTRALDSALEVLEEQKILTRRQGSGIYVSPTLNRKNIAVLLDSLFFISAGISPFWGMLYGMLAVESENRREENSQDFEFHMTTTLTGSNAALPLAVMKSVEAGAIHGALGIGLSNEAGDWLASRKVPYVAFAGRAPWNVIVDYKECCRLAINSLAALGCRRIACWRVAPKELEHPTGAHPYDSYMMGYDDMAVCFAENGLMMDPQFVIHEANLLAQGSAGSSNTRQQMGFDWAMKVFGSSEGVKPDALFIDDDMKTLGVLVALQRLGIRVGQDLKVATVANKGLSSLFGYEDQLIMIEIDPADIVRQMFHLLDFLLEGKESVEEYVWVKPTLKQ